LKYSTSVPLFRQLIPRPASKQAANTSILDIHAGEQNAGVGPARPIASAGGLGRMSRNIRFG
jgi:hypothetical protein